MTVQRDWRSRAACIGVDSDLFFTLSNDWRAKVDPVRAAEAKAICAGCPSRMPCLDDALRQGDAYAIRGGLTPQERRPLHQALVRSA